MKLRSTATRSLLKLDGGLATKATVKELFDKFTCCKEGKRKSQESSVPENKLSLSSNTISKASPEKEYMGKYPDNEFDFIDNSLRFGGRMGRFPVRLL